MKISRATLLLLWLVVVVTAEMGATESVTLVHQGTSDWRIVSPPPGSAATRWAAREVQNRLRQMSGCRLPVIPRTVSKPAVVVGFRHEMTPADRALLPAPTAGYDGYTVAIKPATPKLAARIIVAGENGRGLIYGIYDLLERLGCRWFYPALDLADPEVVPAQKTLSVATGTWAVASSFKYRICALSTQNADRNPQQARKHLVWAMQARFNTVAWSSGDEGTSEAWCRQLAQDGLTTDLIEREMFLEIAANPFPRLLAPEDFRQYREEWFRPRTTRGEPGEFASGRFLLPLNRSPQQWVTPPLTLEVQTRRQHCREQGVTTVTVVLQPAGCWWNQGLSGYLAGRCFYDDRVDPWDLLRDYGLRYFGPRAGPFLTRYFEAWAREPESFCDPKILADQRQLWMVPATRSAEDDPSLAYRVSKVEKLHTLAEDWSEMLLRHGQSRQTRQAGRPSQADRETAQDRLHLDAMTARARTLAGLDQGLFDCAQIEALTNAAVPGLMK